MTGATIITTARADWTRLASRPAGWRLRRLEVNDTTATYIVWDPNKVACAVFLAYPPAPAIAEAIEAAGFTQLADGQLTNTHVWAGPAGAALANAA